LKRAALAALLSLLSATGCLGTREFRCHDHAQCGAGAFCELDGHCSVADATCASQRRYVDSAANDSGRCVGVSCGANVPVTLSAGGGHACLVRHDGAVLCWGRNDDGQLGDGTRTPRSLAVRVAGLDAIAVAAGDRHTCAVQRDHSVVCWGADDTGQLGDAGAAAADPSTAPGSDRLQPAPVPGVSSAVGVAAGQDFSCAVLADGTARCWGSGARGQMGSGATATTPQPPVAVYALDGIRAIGAGSQHACALRDDETLWCWGANGQAQLGVGTTADAPAPARVSGLTEVTAVGAGQTHTCAVTRAAGLYCWGSNTSGELGTTEGAAVSMPARVPIVTDPISVSAGVQYTCAVRKSGGVYCWGENNVGQLGQGGTNDLSAPVAVTGLVTGAAIAGGSAFACALTTDQAVFCWGDDHDGQLGIGSGVVQPLPVAVPGVSHARTVAAGGAHTCAATETAATASTPIERHTLCWGADQAGQLGDGVTDDRARPESVAVDLGARALAAGAAHTCAVAGDGGLWCWGRGSAGQLGLGPSRLFDVRLPTQVMTLIGTGQTVSAGATHTCVLVPTGDPTQGGPSYVCFGANDHGQLGDGTTMPSSQPASTSMLPGGHFAAAIATGAAHTCAIDEDGQAFCWGRGDEGQLGNGGMADSATPVAITLPAGTQLGAISAGTAHTCAVDGGGNAFCWGRGSDGQLGNGSRAGSPTPVAVPGLAGLRAIAAGDAHTCAVATAGAVSCWGANDDGQLGTGDTQPRDAPAVVSGVTGAVGVTAGSAHTCAFATDGSVACWGADTNGQLGDGIALFAATPALARVACE